MFKVGYKAVWNDRIVTVEEVKEDYVTIRVPGALGGVLHMVSEDSLRRVW